MVVRMRPDHLPRALRAEGERIRRAIPKAARAAALRFKSRLVQRTDELGITDQGILKNSWRVLVGGADGAVATVYSDAPHAGIVELGARPHKVSRAGIEAIEAWVKRKLILRPKAFHPLAPRSHRRAQLDAYESEARSAAFAIAKKIEKEGQKPRYLVRDVIPDAKRYFADELTRVLTTQPAGAA